MLIHSRLKTFRHILEQYDFQQPLSRFLSNFYRANKQMGGRDRRIASRMIYSYFRLGKALQLLSPEERLAISLFLCEKEADDFNQEIISQYTSLNPLLLGVSIDQKLLTVKQCNNSFHILDVFPCHEFLSESIDKEAFIKSHFTQPKLWIRIRRGFYEKVIAELQEKGIHYESDVQSNCIGFENTTSIEGLHAFEKGWFEIQDRSSQQVANYFALQQNESWWDCCAGSGGKSLLLFDLEPTVKLTLTEIRPTMIKNLEGRLSKVGARPAHIICTDISDNEKLKQLQFEPFDGIIADVPCSGSGTWDRTPEMLCGYDAKKTAQFELIQQQIIQQAIKYLKPGKPLVYITCSVFKQENEGLISYLEKANKVTIESSAIIKGYDSFADTMFAARVIKT